MKVLVLIAVIFCFLKSAVFQPIKIDSEEFQKILNNSTIDEYSSSEDGVERRKADLQPESCQCKRVDFYISWKEIGFDNWILHPTRLNVGACIGGPVVIMDRLTNRLQFPYEKIMHMRKKLLTPKFDVKKNNTTGTSLMQFKHQVENSDSGNSLAYEFLPGCQATLKPVRIIFKNGIGLSDHYLDNIAIDSCTCI